MMRGLLLLLAATACATRPTGEQVIKFCRNACEPYAIQKIEMAFLGPVCSCAAPACGDAK